MSRLLTMPADIAPNDDPNVPLVSRAAPVWIIFVTSSDECGRYTRSQHSSGSLAIANDHVAFQQGGQISPTKVKVVIGMLRSKTSLDL